MCLWHGDGRSGAGVRPSWCGKLYLPRTAMYLTSCRTLDQGRRNIENTTKSVCRCQGGDVHGDIEKGVEHDICVITRVSIQHVQQTLHEP